MKKTLLLILLTLLFAACSNSNAKSNQTKPSPAKRTDDISLNKENTLLLEKTLETSTSTFIQKNIFLGKSISVGRVSNENGEITSLSQTISNLLEKNIVKFSENKYKIIDRNHLSELLEEWKLSMSGMIDEDSSSQTAKLLGIDIFIFSRYKINRNILNINIKAVNTKTGEIIATENAMQDLASEAAQTSVKFESQNLVLSQNSDITLWTQKNSYQIGEPVKIFIKSKRDGYLTVLDISPKGENSVIYPNLYSKGNFIKAGIIYEVPSENAPFIIEAVEPKGTEIIRAIVSDQPLEELENLSVTYSKENPFGTLNTSFPDLSRGLSVKSKSSKPGSWSETVIKIKIY